MKIIVQRITTSAFYATAFKWSKLFAITGSAQIIIQALGLAGGILVLRLLPTNQYALYTLANTMVGTMLILADGGLTTGVLSLGGKVWQDPKKLGVVLVTGLELRQKFVLFSLLVATPILFYLLLTHGASWSMSILITASLIPGFIASLSGGLFAIPSSLRQDIRPLQENQVKASIVRLLLMVLTLFLFPWAFIAVLGAGLPQIWVNKKLLVISNSYADWKQKSDINVRDEILAFVKRIMPYSIYYSFSGQITIWLVSILGSSTGIAQAGALGRLMMVLNIFSVLFSSLITPRFARLPDDYKVLTYKFVSIELGLILLGLTLVSITYLFPSHILWVLGKSYSNLRIELLLSVVSSCIAIISGLTYSLIGSRGWVINPAFGIPINIISTIVAAKTLNLSSLQGVLELSIVVGSVQALMNIVYGLFKAMNNNYVVKSS